MEDMKRTIIDKGITEAEAIILAISLYQDNHDSDCITNLHKMVLLLEGKFLQGEREFEERQEYIDKFISEHIYGMEKCIYCNKCIRVKIINILMKRWHVFFVISQPIYDSSFNTSKGPVK